MKSVLFHSGWGFFRVGIIGPSPFHHSNWEQSSILTFDKYLNSARSNKSSFIFSAPDLSGYSLSEGPNIKGNKKL
jgi:hypothetical protein